MSDNDLRQLIEKNLAVTIEQIAEVKDQHLRPGSGGKKTVRISYWTGVHDTLLSKKMFYEKILNKGVRDLFGSKES